MQVVQRLFLMAVRVLAGARREAEDLAVPQYVFEVQDRQVVQLTIG